MSNMPRLQILTPEEVESIHLSTLRILQETGIILRHKEAVDILTSAGAKVHSDRILIPAELTEACIAKCPKKVSVRGRGGTTKILGDGSLYFHNLGGARDVFDLRTGKKRYATIEDVRTSTRVLDALENCNTITPFFTPCDVPGSLMSLSMYRHALPHTTKPLQGPGVQYPAEVRAAIRMAEVIGPPSEMLTISVSPVSPLTIPDHEAAAMIEISRAGIAFAPLPCPTAGTTAPFSLAGGIAQQNAEVLGSLVLAQLVNPGLPIIYCGRLAMMETRTGVSVWGGVELGLASAGTVQVANRYGLPVNVYGFSSNAHTLDIQNGFERALNAVIPALAGADELSGIGEMEAGISGSYAQMVADNENAAVIQRVRRGFSANPQTLAVDVIAAAMNGSRNFLAQKHTVQSLRAGEMLITNLAERGAWESWESGGRLGMAEHAQAKFETILHEHHVPPLDDSQERELDAIMQAAEKELTKKS